MRGFNVDATTPEGMSACAELGFKSHGIVIRSSSGEVLWAEPVPQGPVWEAVAGSPEVRGYLRNAVSVFEYGLRVGASTRPMLGRIADLLLPPVCISCRARVFSHGLLCGACFAKIDFIAPPLCARLGIPLPYDAGDPALSAAAIASPPVYDCARAAARYSDTMRELIQSFKYQGPA